MTLNSVKNKIWWKRSFSDQVLDSVAIEDWDLAWTHLRLFGEHVIARPKNMVYDHINLKLSLDLIAQQQYNHTVS